MLVFGGPLNRQAPDLPGLRIMLCLCKTTVSVINSHGSFPLRYTVPLNLNFTYARVQKATAHNIHGNAPE